MDRTSADAGTRVRDAVADDAEALAGFDCAMALETESTGAQRTDEAMEMSRSSYVLCEESFGC